MRQLFQEKLVGFIVTLFLSLAWAGTGFALSRSDLVHTPEIGSGGNVSNQHGEFSVFCGPVLSDIGSGAEIEPSVGLSFRPHPFKAGLQYVLGMEYSRAKGYGSLSHFNYSTGELIFRGEGQVKLHFVDFWAGVTHPCSVGQWVVSPRISVGPSFLAHTGVSPDANPEYGEFVGISWYRELDLWGQVGVEIRRNKLVLDFVFKQGLSTLHDSTSNGDVGGSSTTRPFTPSDMRYESLRFGIGYVF